MLPIPPMHTLYINIIFHLLAGRPDPRCSRSSLCGTQACWMCVFAACWWSAKLFLNKKSNKNQHQFWFQFAVSLALVCIRIYILCCHSMMTQRPVILHARTPSWGKQFLTWSLTPQTWRYLLRIVNRFTDRPAVVIRLKKATNHIRWVIISMCVFTIYMCFVYDITRT